jgi:non-ribosomal peptide synthetase component F
MLPVSLSDDLKELSRRERVTLFMTLLAAFKVLLHYYTDRTDIIVGTDVANRNRAEVEKLIGFFVNQLVLRVSLKDDPTFRRLLERVRDVTLAAYAHQELPFNMLVDALKPKRDLSRNPLFQVMFSFQNVPKGSLRMPGLTMNSLKVETVTSIFDLSLYVSDTGEGLMECFRYNTDLFRPSTADRMLSHFEAILQFVVEQPDARLSELRKILATADLQRRIKEQGEIEKSNLVKLRKVRRKMISQ